MKVKMIFMDIQMVEMNIIYQRCPSSEVTYRYDGFKRHDYVLMEVNPTERTIKYRIDKSTNYVEKVGATFMFKNINFKDKRYRMAVSIGHRQSGLTLIQFKEKKC